MGTYCASLVVAVDCVCFVMRKMLCSIFLTIIKMMLLKHLTLSLDI